MKRFLIMAALLLMASGAMLGQSSQRLTASLTAACTTATTACDATAGSQMKFGVGEYSMASITVHGTFTGATLFFEFSDDGGTNWYPTTCTRNDAAIQEGSEAIADNTNRSWDCGTAAAGLFRVRLHAISSGTVQAAATQSAIQIEPAPTVAVSNTPTGTSSTAIQGAGAAGSANVGNPVRIGANDGTGNLTELSAYNPGANGTAFAATKALAVFGFNQLANDTNTWDNMIAARVLDTALTRGILAAHAVSALDNANGTLSSFANKGMLTDRTVSAANTQLQKTYELRNLSQSLSLHGACSAGTAALTVDVSVDNSNFITVDTVTAAQFTAKVYGAATAGAAAAAASAGPLAPLSFRYVRVTLAACGVSNTGTLTVAAK